MPKLGNNILISKIYKLQQLFLLRSFLIQVHGINGSYGMPKLGNNIFISKIYKLQQLFLPRSFLIQIRGLGFKFVDFLNKSSDVCHTEIKMISSENTFFCLSYKILSVVLTIIVS